jgi:hypothetical protein
VKRSIEPSLRVEHRLIVLGDVASLTTTRSSCSALFGLRAPRTATNTVWQALLA